MYYIEKPNWNTREWTDSNGFIGSNTIDKIKNRTLKSAVA